jgi:hypothetical protein
MFTYLKYLLLGALLLVIGLLAAYRFWPAPPPAPAPELRVELSSTGINLQEPRLVLSIWEGGSNYTRAEALQVKAISPDGQQTWQGPARRYSDYPVEYWVALPDFTLPGDWQLQFTIRTPQTEDSQFALSVAVAEAPIGLTAGMMAYPSQTPTLDSGVQFYQITSDFSPRPGFYNYSIHEAISNGRPTIILFAAPGLCVDRVNIFIIDYTLELVFRDYGSTPLNLIHVEMYSPQTNDYVEAMREWGIAIDANLDSFLPWTYLVDKDGQIVARYNGAVALSEMAPHLEAMLAEVE